MAEVWGTEFSEVTMRSDIIKWSRDVEKRTKVKNWLQSLGIDWTSVRTPEEALTFAFDCLRDTNVPASA
jgi:hypothetical protein